MNVYWFLLLPTALAAYLFGSLRSTVLASNFVFHRSLARLGKGSVWLSNFLRLYGVPGLIKLALIELVKDLLPVLIGGWLLGTRDHAITGRAFAGFCTTLGALYPAFYRFRGGHAAACAVVAAISVESSLGIAVLVVGAAVAWFSRYESLGVIVGALVLVAASILLVDDRPAMILCVLTGSLILLRHLPAAFRLLTGREEKFSLKEDLSYKFDERL